MLLLLRSYVKCVNVKGMGLNYSMDLNDDIKALIAERMEKGKKAYGHGLLSNAGYDWVQEALEEALDLAIYVSAKLLEIKNSTTSK